MFKHTARANTILQHLIYPEKFGCFIANINSDRNKSTALLEADCTSVAYSGDYYRVECQ